MSGVPDAAIAACPDYEAETCRTALQQVLAPFGGLAWVKPGMRIAVKANLVSAMKPERAATTHPMLLRVLTEALVRHGASVVVGDSPGGTYAAGHLNAVYRACGLAAVEEAGGTLNRNFAQREADLPDARVAKHITYTAYLDDADAVISFCKLKSHGMLALSAATKNLFGAIPGTIKPEYHYRYPDPMDFAGMLIDLNEYFRPRLYLVDAVVAMEGNGPTAGTPRPFGALLAGTNPHRIDLLCASLIGLKPENVPTLRAAAERGLTPLDPAQLCVAGDAAAIALERELHKRGLLCRILDGDNIRSGINSNLGFTEADRVENIRRIAEVSKLFLDTGVITIAAFISPNNDIREMAADIIGQDDFLEVYVSTPLEECERRDVKGLYAKARKGEIKNFTGISAPFEEPAHPALTLDTSVLSLEESVNKLLELILPRIQKK
mgnify:CR=1 FL=1